MFLVSTQQTLLEQTVVAYMAGSRKHKKNLHHSALGSNKSETKDLCKLTYPEIVQPLAHGAALVWDLVEVLVKAWLQWNETRKRREIVFCG